MIGAAIVQSSLTLAVISSQYLVWLGLQSILAGAWTVMHLHPWMVPDALRTKRPPDVFVLDLATNRDALGTIRQIREVAPTTKVVLLSGNEDTHSLQEAFTHGVDGVILQVQPPAVVLAVIEALYAPAHQNDGQVDCGVVRVDLKRASKQEVDSVTQPLAWPDFMTERQDEVLRMVGQGLRNKEIADRLCIADSTVRHHLTNIFDKLGVANRQKLLLHIASAPSTPL